MNCDTNKKNQSNKWEILQQNAVVVINSPLFEVAKKKAIFRLIRIEEGDVYTTFITYVWPCFEKTKNSITYEKKHIIMFLYFSLFYTYNNNIPWLLGISFVDGNKNTWQYWELLTKNDWFFCIAQTFVFLFCYDIIFMSRVVFCHTFFLSNQTETSIEEKYKENIFSEKYEWFHN